jgi:uncharacterized protein with von Willebrand factor type A (vWA) domain
MAIANATTKKAVLFARFLRHEGLSVTSAQTLDFIHSLAWIDLLDRRSLRDAARAIFVRHRDQIAPFEAAFDCFWNTAVLDPRTKRSTLSDLRSAPVWILDAARAADLTESAEVATDLAAAYSAAEALRQHDFGALSAAESTGIAAAIAAVARRLPMRRSRRMQLGPQGRQLDLRTTLRRSLRTGGDPVTLARRRRRIKPRPLVLLCDVSGSMERYARILLQFAYALVRANHAGHKNQRKVEAFVFATRLTRVTPYLHAGAVGVGPDRHALAAAVNAAHDWGGGTRIGDCLHTFHTQWAPRVLGRGALVLLISDGCDRGDIAMLGHQLARLRRRSHRLIWLNPWLGQEGYQPTVRGMQAALPHIDRLLPVHNLASLEQLVAILGDLDG